MSEFTAGPWTINPKGHLESGWYARQFDAKFYIATINKHRAGSADRVPIGDEQEANARLIAAAPDMYDALKEIEARCKDDDWEMTPQNVEIIFAALTLIARGALAKAEGGQ